jgi:hypothetical protein
MHSAEGKAFPRERNFAFGHGGGGTEGTRDMARAQGHVRGV